MKYINQILKQIMFLNQNLLLFHFQFFKKMIFCDYCFFFLLFTWIYFLPNTIKKFPHQCFILCLNFSYVFIPKSVAPIHPMTFFSDSHNKRRNINSILCLLVDSDDNAVDHSNLFQVRGKLLKWKIYIKTKMENTFQNHISPNINKKFYFVNRSLRKLST
jgi:hypothetical protein